MSRQNPQLQVPESEGRRTSQASSRPTSVASETSAVTADGSTGLYYVPQPSTYVGFRVVNFLPFILIF